MALKCYLDDSATSGFPIITLAGFVGTAQQWEPLEHTLNGIMDRYGVTVFHAKEFHDTKDYFAGWSKIKKRTFATELSRAAGGNIAGVSVTIRKSPIEKWKKETK